MNIAAHPVSPEEIMALLDGELSDAEAQAFTSHIGHCLECNAIAAQFRATSQSLTEWNVSPVPPRLEEFVANAAAGTAAAWKLSKPNLLIRMSFWTRRQWAFGGAGTVAALLTVLVIYTASLPSEKKVQPMLSDKLEIGDSLSAQPKVRQTEAASGSLSVDGQPIPDQRSKVALNGRNIRSLMPLSTPAIAADSNGLFHGLGDHAANSFTNDSEKSAAPTPMIARTVSLSIVVKDFAAARAALDAILARHHGYAAQLAVSTPENSARSFQSSLRIPAPELTAAAVDLRNLGRVEYENQSAEEVTAQHADLVARLKTSRETEARFEAILQQHTGNVSEVLQVEEGIARVRGDIERMEAEQKSLEHRVDFADVELQLSEEYKAQLNPPAASVSNRMHNALVAGYRNAAAAVLGIVLFFVEYGPTLLIFLAIFGLPAFLVWRRYRRLLARS